MVLIKPLVGMKVTAINGAHGKIVYINKVNHFFDVMFDNNERWSYNIGSWTYCGQEFNKTFGWQINTAGFIRKSKLPSWF